MGLNVIVKGTSVDWLLRIPRRHFRIFCLTYKDIEVRFPCTLHGGRFVVAKRLNLELSMSAVGCLSRFDEDL